MKSKVDPLMKLIDQRRIEGSRALMAAQHRLMTAELELRALIETLVGGEARFEDAQKGPLSGQEHAFHHHWLGRMRALIDIRQREVTTEQAQVELCRATLTALHLEMRTLEKYKENLAERDLLERKALEAKELDEIAGQKHRRLSGELAG